MKSGSGTEKPENWSLELERRILECLKQVRFGTVTLVIQDSKVIQIDKNEKIRLGDHSLQQCKSR